MGIFWKNNHYPPFSKDTLILSSLVKRSQVLQIRANVTGRHTPTLNNSNSSLYISEPEISLKWLYTIDSKYSFDFKTNLLFYFGELNSRRLSPAEGVEHIEECHSHVDEDYEREERV